MEQERKRKLAIYAVIAVMFLILILCSSGALNFSKARPGLLAEKAAPLQIVREFQAQKKQVEIFEEAVGTVRSRRSISIAPQTTAQILVINAEPGQHVKQGEVLIKLD